MAKHFLIASSRISRHFCKIYINFLLLSHTIHYIQGVFLFSSLFMFTRRSVLELWDSLFQGVVFMNTIQKKHCGWAFQIVFIFSCNFAYTAVGLWLPLFFLHLLTKNKARKTHRDTSPDSAVAVQVFRYFYACFNLLIFSFFFFLFS